MKNSLLYLYLVVVLLGAFTMCQDDQWLQPGSLTSDALLILAPSIPNPISIRSDRNGTKFVAFKQGIIQYITPIVGFTPFLDISTLVSPADPAILDRGLLGFDLHRDFDTNGLFYVFYTAASASPPAADLCPGGVLSSGLNCETISNQYSHIGRLVEYRWDRIAAPVENRVLFVVKLPFNGGNSWNTLKYNRYQNRLYLALGDGGCANDPFSLVQNQNYFNGKLLSFDMSEDMTWACATPISMFSEIASVCNGGVGRIILEGFGLRNPTSLMFQRFGDDDSFLVDRFINNLPNPNNEDLVDLENDEWSYFLFDNSASAGEIHYAGGDQMANFGWPFLDSNICNLPLSHRGICPDMSIVPSEPLGIFKLPYATVANVPGYTVPTISSGALIDRSFLHTFFMDPTTEEDIGDDSWRNNLQDLILFAAPAANGTAGSALYGARISSNFDQQDIDNFDVCNEENANGQQGWGNGALVRELIQQQLISIPVTAGLEAGSIITAMIYDGVDILFGTSTGAIYQLRLARAAVPVVTGKK